MQCILKVLCTVCTLNLHKPDAENNAIPTTGLSFYLRLIFGFGDYLDAKPVNAASVF